ncbi:MAG: hypothetical protein VX777_06135 [Chlamydiota bacterium]|nr:hypothetical protein [Chlamydiota bacterium]
MINKVDVCKLNFSNSIEYFYESNKEIRIEVISTLFNESFANISPDAQVTTKFTLSELKDRFQQIDSRYFYKLDNSFKAFDHGSTIKTEVTAELISESVKTTAQHIEELKNCVHLKETLSIISTSITALKPLNQIISELSSFEYEVINSIERLVFKYLMPNLDRASFIDKWKSLGVDEQVFAWMRPSISSFEIKQVCCYPDVFYINSLEKIITIINDHFDPIDRDKSITLFKQVDEITADKVMDAWDSTSFRFDVIAVLKDKNFIDLPLLMSIVEKYMNLPSDRRTLVFSKSLGWVFQNISIESQYKVVYALIAKHEANLIPREFWLGHNHEQAAVKDIASKILASGFPEHIHKQLLLMKIKDQNYLAEILLELANKQVNLAENFNLYGINDLKQRESIALKWASNRHHNHIPYLKNFNLEPNSDVFNEILDLLAYHSPKDFVSNYKTLQISKFVMKEILFKISTRCFVLDCLHGIDDCLTEDEKVTLYKNNVKVSVLKSISSLKTLNIKNTTVVSELIFLALNESMAKYLPLELFTALSKNLIEGIDYYPFFKEALSEWGINEVARSLCAKFPADCIERVSYDIIKGVEQGANLDEKNEVLKIASQHSEIFPSIILKAAGLKVFSVSFALKNVILADEIYSEIAKKEAVCNPMEFLYSLRYYKFSSEKEQYELIKIALESVESVYEFHFPDFGCDSRREEIYQLAKSKIKDGMRSLDLISVLGFDDENLRYSYSKSVVEDEKYIGEFAFWDSLKKLELTHEHFFEIIITLLTKRGTLFLFNENKARIALFKQLTKEKRAILLDRLDINFEQLSKFTYEFTLLNAEDQATLLDFYLIKDTPSYQYRGFIPEIKKSNIHILYPLFLKILKQKPASVERLEFNILTPEQIKEVVQTVYSSTMRQPYISNTTKIIDIATLYLSDNQLYNFIQKLMYDQLINGFSSNAGYSFESEIERNDRLMNIKLVSDFFLRNKIKRDFESEYSLESCICLLPESLQSELKSIDHSTTYLPLKQNLIWLLLEIADHYYFNNLFRRDYNKNIYIKKVIHQIIKIRSPHLKRKLTDVFFRKFFIRNKVAYDRLKFFKRLCEEKQIKDKAVLVTLLLSSYFSTIETNKIKELAYAISAKKSLIEDRIIFTRFMAKFEALLASKKINGAKVFSIVLHTIQKYDAKEACQRLSLISAVVMLEGGDNIDSDGSFDISERLYIKNIKERLNILGFSNDEFIKLFKTYFESYRDKYAIVKYIASQADAHYKLGNAYLEYIDSGDECKGSDKKDVKKYSALNYLKMHMLDVFEGVYKENRYSLEKSRHLKTVFHQNEPALILWQENFATEALNLFNPDELVVRNEDINYFNKFRQWIIDDKHIPQSHMLSNFYVLNKILSNKVCPPSEVIHEAITQLESNLDKAFHKYNIQLQIMVLRLLITDHPTLLQLKILYEKVSSYEEFKYNIMNLIENIQLKNQVVLSNCIAEISDDPESLLMMGSDCGTCQRVDGDPEYNQGLMGVFNGKYKLVTIRDKDSGKIYARTLLKVLLNKETNEGVLFMERIYTKAADPRLKLGVIKLCLSHAKKMGMPLLQSSIRGRKYPNSIYSEVDRFNIEYVDALGGVQVGGYTIENCVYVDH